ARLSVASRTHGWAGAGAGGNPPGLSGPPPGLRKGSGSWEAVLAGGRVRVDRDGAARSRSSRGRDPRLFGRRLSGPPSGGAAPNRVERGDRARGLRPASLRAAGGISPLFPAARRGRRSDSGPRRPHSHARFADVVEGARAGSRELDASDEPAVAFL